MNHREQHAKWIDAHRSTWSVGQRKSVYAVSRDPALPEYLPDGDLLLDLSSSRLVPREQWNVITDRVYLIGCNGEFVKIGYTGILFRRISALRQANPYPLEPLAIIAGDARLERALINYFSPYRTTGEWFMRVGELAEFLRSPAVIEAAR